MAPNLRAWILHKFAHNLHGETGWVVFFFFSWFWFGDASSPLLISIINLLSISAKFIDLLYSVCVVPNWLWNRSAKMFCEQTLDTTSWRQTKQSWSNFHYANWLTLVRNYYLSSFVTFLFFLLLFSFFHINYHHIIAVSMRPALFKMRTDRRRWLNVINPNPTIKKFFFLEHFDFGIQQIKKTTTTATHMIKWMRAFYCNLYHFCSLAENEFKVAQVRYAKHQQLTFVYLGNALFVSFAFELCYFLAAAEAEKSMCYLN